MRIRWGIRVALVAAVAAFLAEVGPIAGREIPGPPTSAPEIHSPVWINGGPTSIAAQRGRVVLVEFWTYG
jgi:hypothetical protein